MTAHYYSHTTDHGDGTVTQHYVTASGQAFTLTVGRDMVGTEAFARMAQIQADRMAETARILGVANEAQIGD
jgi:hypothetical protein